jgi:hypothetical protein
MFTAMTAARHMMFAGLSSLVAACREDQVTSPAFDLSTPVLDGSMQVADAAEDTAMRSEARNRERRTFTRSLAAGHIPVSELATQP